jgi:hypothetical protein
MNGFGDAIKASSDGLDIQCGRPGLFEFGQGAKAFARIWIVSCDASACCSGFNGEGVFARQDRGTEEG